MVFSTSSLVSVAFMSSLGIMALWLYLRDINGIVQIGIKGTFIIIALILIRIIFPFEFSFARTIPSDYIMVFIRDTLKNEISLFTITLIVKEFLLATWLLGIVIHGFMAIKARIDFRHFIDRLPRKDNDKVNQILSSIMSKRHKTTPFEIICSSEISIPMLYGIINPKIIIPDIDLSKNEWEFILEHEVGHYYNYDLQTILFIQFLNVIYWWNPLIYLLNAEVDNLLEIRADAFVTKDLDEAHKIEYLSCLLSVLKKLPKNNRKHDVIALTGAKKSVLSHRYQFILARNESPIKRVKPSLKTIFLIGIVCMSFFFTFEAASSPEEMMQGAFSLARDNSYIVVNQADTGYDVYVDNEFFFTSKEMHESFLGLNIYDNLEEANINEKKRQEHPILYYFTDSIHTIFSSILR